MKWLGKKPPKEYKDGIDRKEFVIARHYRQTILETIEELEDMENEPLDIDRHWFRLSELIKKLKVSVGSGKGDDE